MIYFQKYNLQPTVTKMKTLENISVYICDHCKKRYFVKGACERHEKVCYSNPENYRACSACIHIEEIEIKYTKEEWFDGRVIEQKYSVKGFRCKKLDKKLYPFKVEKKGLPDKYPESFEDQEPMPRVCEHEAPF